MLQWALLRPSVFNAALLGLPLLCLGSLLIPSIMGNSQYHEMLQRHQSWLEAAADPHANVAELAAEARSIWIGICRAYWFDSITFAGECREDR